MKKELRITPGNGNTNFYKKMLSRILKTRPPVVDWKEIAIKNGKVFNATHEILDWSSAELPVIGRLDVIFNLNDPSRLRRLSLPLHSSFLVTGITKEEGNYQLAWCSSMS